MYLFRLIKNSDYGIYQNKFIFKHFEWLKTVFLTLLFFHFQVWGGFDKN